MDIIVKQANRFVENHIMYGLQYKETLSSAKSKVNEIDSKLDKIKFLNVLLEATNNEYAKHLPNCGDLENCTKNFAYETIQYFLTQELNRLGVNFNDDTFSKNEKQEAESKIEEILSSIEQLKHGQQIIYEELTNEINELRDLLFLGKKKWYQLLIGKSVEMVASGIVSETVVKGILDNAKISFPTLLKW